MSGIYCDNCGYERIECACKNPGFYYQAKLEARIRHQEEKMKYLETVVAVLQRSLTEFSEYEEIIKRIQLTPEEREILERGK